MKLSTMVTPKLFRGFLSEKFVSQNRGIRVTKTEFTDMISVVKCTVKEGGNITDPHMTMIDADAYVFSYGSDTKGSCAFAGDVVDMPSRVRTATVYIRNGEKWQPVFHGQNPITTHAATQDADEKLDVSASDVAEIKSEAAAEPALDRPSSDPTTKALMAAENAVWDAWMKKDAKRIEALAAKDIAFVNIFGNYFADKAAAIKDWTSDTCSVKSFSLTNGTGTAVSPNVGIVTFTGTIKGSCGGADISGQKIYGNTVYVKNGTEWK